MRTPSPSLSPSPRECLLSFYCTLLLQVFPLSAARFIVSCCAPVSHLVMYAPHVFDPPPCTPVLCTLHNLSVLSSEVHLCSLSLFHSPIPLFLTPPSPSSLHFFGSNPGHHSFFLPPSSNPKPWKLEQLALSHTHSFSLSLYLAVLYWLPSCYRCSTLFPSLFLYFPSFLPSPSRCLLLSTLPVVSLGVKEAAWCVCVCVGICAALFGKVSLDWACHSQWRGPGLHYYHKAVTNSI